jgi:predicted lipid-binding transport protein (Tim44 family)
MQKLILIFGRMKFWSMTFTLAFAAVLALGAFDAQAAKRLGGGKSIGKQSSNVTQRDAAAPAPQAPVQNAAAARPAPAPMAAPPQRRPWGAMLGGLAAGLGLAWLAHSMGMGEAFGQVIMFALLAMLVVMAIGWVMRRKGVQATPASPFAFQGAGATPAQSPVPYRPENVGNDASARPFERSSLTPLDGSSGGSGGSMIGSALSGSQTWGIPAGFDADGFLRSAKGNFITLQAAWDRADIAALRAMMTDSMLVEIQSQLAERESHAGATPNHTDVVMIEARLLGIEELDDEYMASVEYSGMIREEPSAGPSPFREVWNMSKSKTGSGGWLVAGVQALQ